MTTVAELFGIEAPAWMADARCAETDPDAFFPEKGGRTGAVIAVCRSCPVINQCLAHALDNDERHGIWGAASPRERRHIRERQSAAKRAAA